MEGVEFDIDNTQTQQHLEAKAEQTRLKRSPLYALLGKIGVTDPTAASVILLGVAALFFGVAIFIYAGVVSNKASTTIDPVQEAAQIKELQAMQSSQPAPTTATPQ